MDEVTLAVLAGGAGSRMGMPKGQLKIAGQPILARLLEQAKWDGPTMLVTAPGREHPEGCDAFTFEAVDPVVDAGPLCGVRTALTHATTPLIAIIAVDMPCITQKHLAWLTSELKGRTNSVGVMLRHQDRVEPFPCAFRVRPVLELVNQQFETGRRSVAALALGGAIAVIEAPSHWDSDVWTNLNDPVSLAAFVDAF